MEEGKIFDWETNCVKSTYERNRGIHFYYDTI